jgi:sarcosine oxidase gamma subunit
MIPPYDIFKTEPNGSSRWIEAASTLDGAKARAQTLAAVSPGEYLIVSQRTGNRLVMKSNGAGEAARNQSASSHGDEI